MPSVWFTLFEQKLQQCNFNGDEQRRNALSSCLPNDILLVVHDLLLLNEPTYQRIKQPLIQWFEPSSSFRVSELLNYSTVTEERPTQFLVTLRTKLAQSNMTTDMIRELFIDKMPEHICNSLIAMQNISLDELALTADKMVCSCKEANSKQSLFVVNSRGDFSGSCSAQDNTVFSQLRSLETNMNDVLRLVKNSDPSPVSRTSNDRYAN